MKEAQAEAAGGSQGVDIRGCKGTRVRRADSQRLVHDARREALMIIDDIQAETQALLSQASALAKASAPPNVGTSSRAAVTRASGVPSAVYEDDWASGPDEPDQTNTRRRLSPARRSPRPAANLVRPALGAVARHRPISSQ